MNRKYIIPIAIAKLLLAFLVLHLFFSSCESEDLYYKASLYTEGPLVEVPASFGYGDQIYAAGDTIALEILIDHFNLVDAISGSDVLLSNPTFYCNFCFVNSEGERLEPQQMHLVAGDVRVSAEKEYMTTFGYQLTNNSRLMNSVGSDLPYLKIEFVFDRPGDYVLYFMNVPNHTNTEGDVDIYYNYVDGLAESQAYAVYYFDKQLEQRHNLAEEVRSEILDWCESEQASIDFTISGGL